MNKEERIKELEKRVGELEAFQIEVVKTIGAISDAVNSMTETDEMILKCFQAITK